MPYLTFYYLKTEYWRLILTVFNGFNCIYREALHEASDELEEAIEDKDESSFGEGLSCDTSATELSTEPLLNWDSLLLLELVRLIVLERGLEVLWLRTGTVVVIPELAAVVLFRIRFRSSVNLA